LKLCELVRCPSWYSLVVTQPSTSHQLVCAHCFVRYAL